MSQCKKSIGFNVKCDVHVLGEIHLEADWVGFILVLCFISFIWTVCYWCPLSSHLISVPVCVVSLCRALQPQWSLPPQSVCVCRLSAGAAVQSPCCEWWKCVLFIRVREGESEGGMYCIDMIVKMTCDGHKCIIKMPKNCKIVCVLLIG